MARRIQEDWNTATDGRERFLYMFKGHENLFSVKIRIGNYYKFSWNLVLAHKINLG